jgi:hypothetical protein
LLACPDCSSEPFQIWRGPNMVFTVRHSQPCPGWDHPGREVAMVLVDAAPGRQPEEAR